MNILVIGDTIVGLDNLVVAQREGRVFKFIYNTHPSDKILFERKGLFKKELRTDLYRDTFTVTINDGTMEDVENLWKKTLEKIEKMLDKQ